MMDFIINLPSVICKRCFIESFKRSLLKNVSLIKNWAVEKTIISTTSLEQYHTQYLTLIN